MNAVDLIRHEVTDLPEAQRAEVLDFIGYLKTPHPSNPVPAAPVDRLNELAAFFAPYRKDLSTFVFDREHANAR
jgi:hypothetical protein